MKKEKTTNLNQNKQYNVGASRYAILNNQSHVGAGPVSAQNAITLVALVVTIIVLLLLAGVTINLILGNNGIFNTAQKAAENYTEVQNKELADLKEFENIVDKVTKAPEYEPSLLKLKPGDYVKYDTGVKEAGENGVATFRVLYDATSEYGLQIISDKSIANVTLGGSSWETGKTTYNNAIDTLNQAAMTYKNDLYATDARCVGSNPANKNAKAETNVILPLSSWTEYTRPTDWTSDDTGCKDTDKNYITDIKAMQVAKIEATGEYYWLASNIVTVDTSDSSLCGFAIRNVRHDGTLRGSSLCTVKSDGSTNRGYTWSYGLRPCIVLKPDIKVTSGDGASEATAYIL